MSDFQFDPDTAGEKALRWTDAFSTALQNRADSGLLRQRRAVRHLGPTRIEIEGRELLNFASNDYLGLSQHPRLINAAIEATRTAGVGSGAAALISGHTRYHLNAEAALARWKGTQSAVLLGSGFVANLAVVAALAAVGNGNDRRKPPRFLIDKLAHASLVDAVRNTSHFRVFPHNHLGKLNRLLGEAPPDELQVVVTESIFSMDGDAADLAGLVELRRKHRFFLLIDEAHAAGVYGLGGAGLAAELGLSSEIDASVVTLSKGMGGVGGAVCGSAALCQAIVNFSRAYIFTTSVPPATAAVVPEAIAVMNEEPHRQTRLRDIARLTRTQLSQAGFAIPPSDSPIIPIVLGSAQAAVEASAHLFARGYFIPAVRPPTVAAGTSRLRLTLCSENTDEQLAGLLKALTAIEKGSSAASRASSSAGAIEHGSPPLSR